MTAITAPKFDYAPMAAGIAEKIRDGIKDAPMVGRQDILAVCVDLSPSEFSEYMTGKRVWEVALLWDVARVLEVAVWELMLDGE